MLMLTRAKKMLENSKVNNPELYKEKVALKPRAKNPPSKFQTALEKCEEFVKNLPAPRHGVKRKLPETETRVVGNSSKKESDEKENTKPSSKESGDVETNQKEIDSRN